MSLVDTQPLAALGQPRSGHWKCLVPDCAKPPYTRLKPGVRHVYEHFYRNRDPPPEAPAQFLTYWCELCRFEGQPAGLKSHYTSNHSGWRQGLAHCTKCFVAWPAVLMDHLTRDCPCTLGEWGRGSRPELFGRHWDGDTLEYDYSGHPDVKKLLLSDLPEEVKDAANKARTEEFAKREAKARLAIVERLGELERRRGERALWGDVTKIDDDIAEVKSELELHDRGRAPSSPAASLSKSRVPLTARKQLIYQRLF